MFDFRVLWPVLAFWPVLSMADMYSCMDANGVVAYSASPPQGPCYAWVKTKRRASNSPADFPRVDPATQRVRDNDRRRILEMELAEENRLLADAQRNGVPDLIEHHGRNVAALQKEISYAR